MCQLHIKKLVTQISSFTIHLTIYTYHSSQQSVNKSNIPRGITKKPYLEFEFRKLVWWIKELTDSRRNQDDVIFCPREVDLISTWLCQDPHANKNSGWTSGMREGISSSEIS